MCEINKQNVKEKLKIIAAYYGKDVELNQLNEECAEVIKAVSKYNRATGKGMDHLISPDDAFMQLKDEMADVLQVIFELMVIFKIPEEEMLSLINYKADRQLKRIKDSMSEAQPKVCDNNICPDYLKSLNPTQNISYCSKANTCESFIPPSKPTGKE